MAAETEKALHFVRQVPWAEVFTDWETRELGPRWTKVATEVKGWPDWRSWRSFSAKQLHLDEREWRLHELTNPGVTIPAMLIGPFTGWQFRVPTPNTHTFADLMTIPEQFAEWSNRPDIVAMGTTFPSPTTMVGLLRPDGRIVLLEGHHRAVAVALAAAQERTTTFGTVLLYLANLPATDLPLLASTLARGSTKEPPK